MANPDDSLSSPDHPSFNYEDSSTLFLFTSLTAGSSHILTATSRLESILKTQQVPFRAIDVATDEKARRIWSRRAGSRKLPGLVLQGFVLADLPGVEEWNEQGVLKERLKGEGVDLSAQKATGLDGTKDASASSPGTSPVPTLLRNVVGSLPIREQKSQSRTPSASYGRSSSSALAAEAAALAAQRKQDPSTSPFGPRVKLRNPSSRVTSAQKPADEIAPPIADKAAAAASSDDIPPQTTTSPRSKPSSPDPIAADATLEDSQHNTSSAAALPPISIPKSPPKVSVSGADGEAEADSVAAEPVSLPAVIPPSETNPKSPEKFALSGAVGEAEADSITAESASLPAAPPPSAIGPVSPGESDADALLSVKAGSTPTHHRGSSLSLASDEEIKKIESESSIPEEEEEEEEKQQEEAVAEESSTGEEKETQNDGQHVKFQEDRLKGQATDALAAEESVGD